MGLSWGSPRLVGVGSQRRLVFDLKTANSTFPRRRTQKQCMWQWRLVTLSFRPGPNILGQSALACALDFCGVPRCGCGQAVGAIFGGLKQVGLGLDHNCCWGTTEKIMLYH